MCIRDSGAAAAEDGDLRAVCRDLQRLDFGSLAHQLAVGRELEELVLPPGARRDFELALAWARQGGRLPPRGALDRGGVALLFRGTSGTGKTLAAQVIARALELDLYRVDLSQIVNKYIGETEKNLARVFDL